jgi:hypothetical protein
MYSEEKESASAEGLRVGVYEPRPPAVVVGPISSMHARLDDEATDGAASLPERCEEEGREGGRRYMYSGCGSSLRSSEEEGRSGLRLFNGLGADRPRLSNGMTVSSPDLPRVQSALSIREHRSVVQCLHATRLVS